MTHGPRDSAQQAHGRPVAAADGKRPGFPVRLATNAGVPSANKSAMPARPTQINPMQPRSAHVSLQKPMPAGVGLDSQTVRSRMVDKLARQGLLSTTPIAPLEARDNSQSSQPNNLLSAYPELAPLQRAAQGQALARLQHENQGRQAEAGPYRDSPPRP